MSLSLGKALAFFTTPYQVNTMISKALATRGITIDATNYTDLVTNYPPASHNGAFAWVEASQGTAWLPGTVGGTYYPLGLYHSNGTAWIFTPSPSQATQAEVDTGTNNDKFVTPQTLFNDSKWNTKVDSVSVSTANGLAGTSSGGVTPALTLSTTVTGMVKGNGTALSAATAGTDYSAPITVNNITTNANYYPVFVDSTGVITTLNTSPTNYYVNPSNGNITSSGSVTANSGAFTTTVSAQTITSTNGGDGSNSAVVITGNNGYGGANYLGALTLNNTGATSGKKFFRINATGTLEVVNDAYSSVIFSLTDAGAIGVSNLNVSSTIATYGLQTTVLSAGTINATTIISGTPAAAKSSYNVALGTTVGVDNYTFRIANDGGIFPQVQSALFTGSVDSCWSFFASVTGNATIVAQNSGTLVPNNSWVTLFGNHGMDSRGDTVIVHITDKNEGKIYRVTFIVSNNASNTTGYNIVIERII